MSKTWLVTKGVLRLVIAVLACLILAALGYVAIIAWIVHFPPDAIQ
jgi:type II secretory pathway component PulL